MKKKLSKENKIKLNTNQILKLVGIGLAAFLIIVSIVFICFVVKLAFIPSIYVGLGFIALVVFALLCVVLQEWKVSGIITKIFCLLFSIAMIIGCGYIGKTIKTIDKVSGAKKQMSYMNVYVMNGSVAKTINDTNNGTYGVLFGMDVENTQKVVDGLVDIKFSKKEYITVADMVTALRNGEVQAVILNQAYVGLVTSLPGFENFEAETRSIYNVGIETVVAEGDNDPTLPPVTTFTPIPSPTPFPDVTKKPNEPTDIPATATPTPTPYTGLAYTFGDLVVPKENYLYGNSNIFTCYISGIDTYGTPDVVSRSDVNILVTVNLNTHQIMMMNTPRDYYIPLSGANMRDKLTHAGVFGINCSIKTLSSLYGVNVDYYAKINFSGFIKLIDSLGGIDIDVPEKFTLENGFVYEQGINHLDGDSALAFVRERHAFASADNERGRNQMRMITAVINKLISTDALLHFNDLFDALSSCIVTNMSYDRIAELVRYQVETMSTWNITSNAVTGPNGWDLCYALGAANDVTFPNEDSVREARQKFRNVYNNLNP